MWPLLLDGDIVNLRKVRFDKVNINDIVCFKKKGQLITHRVIYKAEKYLIAKGDNNSTSDGKIYPKNIIGIVNTLKRGGQIFRPENIYLLQSTIYFKEIVRVKKALEKENIDLVFLKGLPLHMYYEGTHPRRIYADCDILISKHNFLKTEAILLQKGYIKSKYTFSKKGLEGSEATFQKFVSGVFVKFDVHMEVVFLTTRVGKLNSLYPQRLITELTTKFVNEKTTVNLDNEFFSILSRENLLIYLSLHLFNHNFKGSYRYDFIRSLLGNKIDFLEVSQVVGQFKLKGFVYPCFLFLKKYYPDIGIDKFSLMMPDKSKLAFIKKRVLESNIFEDDYRPGLGEHFKLIIYLSPASPINKMSVFFRPKVIYHTIRAMKLKILDQNLIWLGVSLLRSTD